MADLRSLFETRPQSIKLHCTICGHAGYPWPEYPEGPPSWDRWWANSCIRGHAPCPRCGKQLCVTKHGKARTHGRCPKAA